MGILYVVATPIGNLKDITFRALEILKLVDFIICEDTRQTKKLLDRYQIEKPLISYHQHTKIQKIDYIINQIAQGKSCALVSDAGTPSISDPGSLLVARAVQSKIKIVPLPGPSALTAAASISGFFVDRFIFLGFPPHKKGRQKFFEQIKESIYPVIFYESPYRILKTLSQIKDLVNDRQIVVCRELTKMFETVYRGSIDEVISQLEKEKIRGEFVVIINRE
jgi:16S rRNA (cytidine1402-2'-O)-methyltransferase